MKLIIYMIGMLVGILMIINSPISLPLVIIIQFLIIIYLLTTKKIHLNAGQNYWLILSEKARFGKIKFPGVRQKDLDDLASIRKDIEEHE